MRDPSDIDNPRGLKNKLGSKTNVDEDYNSGGFANINSQVVNNGQGMMLRQQMDARIQNKM